jgi:hypothetical protein
MWVFATNCRQVSEGCTLILITPGSGVTLAPHARVARRRVAFQPQRQLELGGSCFDGGDQRQVVLDMGHRRHEHVQSAVAHLHPKCGVDDLTRRRSLVRQGPAVLFRLRPRIVRAAAQPIFTLRTLGSRARIGIGHRRRGVGASLHRDVVRIIERRALFERIDRKIRFHIVGRDPR